MTKKRYIPQKWLTKSEGPRLDCTEESLIWVFVLRRCSKISFWISRFLPLIGQRKATHCWLCHSSHIYNLHLAHMLGCSISNKTTCAPSEDSDQPGQIRYLRCSPEDGSFAAQRVSGKNWSDAQADLSLRWSNIQSCRKCCVLAHLPRIN